MVLTAYGPYCVRITLSLTSGRLGSTYMYVHASTIAGLDGVVGKFRARAHSGHKTKGNDLRAINWWVLA